jgi:DNA topoisomerase-1
VLQDRNSVRLESRRFFPEDRGRLVTAFLTSFFERYVAYGFTAEMEEKLDDISGGRIDWKKVLSEFWQHFSAAVGDTKELRVKEVLEALDTLLGPHFFRDNEDGSNARACPGCADGRLNLKLGKFGAFIGCSNYPECRYTRPLVPARDGEATDAQAAGVDQRSLGNDPATGFEVTLRKGPYGYYVQLGDAEGEGKKKTKPKRSSLARGMDPGTVDLDKALALLSLPREVGAHPETGETITTGIGRFGPYVRVADTYVSLKGDDDVLSLGLNRAVALLADASKKKSKGKAVGNHPADGKPVMLKAGRYGPYVEHGKIRASLPKGASEETLDLDEAVSILAAKSANSPGKGGGRKTPTKKPAKKPTKEPATKKKITG